MSISSPRTHGTKRLTRLALGTVFLCAVPALYAQPGIRNLTGTVTDAHHEPLAGAIVQLHDDNTGSVVSYITNRTGRYTFKRLSTDDDYHVSATFRDQHSRSRYLSKLNSKPNPSLPLVVKLH
jgi:hypothetical protein